MITFHRTDSTNQDFIALVSKLDAYLAITDGEEHAYYAQYNGLDSLRHVVVAFDDGRAVGCGAIKPYQSDTMEVKRMYVPPEQRGKGIASKLLLELESWAKELGFSRCILETGKRQVEAVGLYHKNAYQLIDNYGQYAKMDNSVCFEKWL
ncbi:MAG: GNAT family N-acetyltransferase [Bacteroidia bacterium]